MSLAGTLPTVALHTYCAPVSISAPTQHALAIMVAVPILQLEPHGRPKSLACPTPNVGVVDLGHHNNLVYPEQISRPSPDQLCGGEKSRDFLVSFQGNTSKNLIRQMEAAPSRHQRHSSQNLDRHARLSIHPSMTACQRAAFEERHPPCFRPFTLFCEATGRPPLVARLTTRDGVLWYGSILQ